MSRVIKPEQPTDPIKDVEIEAVFSKATQIIAAIILVQNEQSLKPSEAIYLLALFSSFIAAPLLS